MATFYTKALADPTVTEGSISGGSYADTLTSNDTRLVIADSGGSPSARYKFDISWDGVAPAAQWSDAAGINEDTAQSIKITLEAQDTGSTDDYYILLWDFGTSQWDEIGAVMSIGSTEETFVREVTTNVDDYISSDEIKVRIANGKALGKGGAPNNNGSLGIDYLGVQLTNAGGVVVENQYTATQTGSGSSMTISNVTIASGEVLYVCVGMRDGGGTISSVVFNTSETLTEEVFTIGDLDQGIYSLSNPTATTADVVVTFGTSRDRPKIAVAYAISGVDTATMTEDAQYVDQDATAISVSVTSETDDALLLACGSQLSDATNPTVTIDGSMTETINQEVQGTFGGRMYQGYKTIASSGSATADWTSTHTLASTTAAVVIAKAAAAAAFTPKVMMY